VGRGSRRVLAVVLAAAAVGSIIYTAVVVLLFGIVCVAVPPSPDDLVSFAFMEQPEILDFVAAEAVVSTVSTTVPPDLSGYAIAPAPAPALPDPPALRPGEKPRIYLAGDSAMYTLVHPVEWIDAMAPLRPHVG